MWQGLLSSGLVWGLVLRRYHARDIEESCVWLNAGPCLDAGEITWFFTAQCKLDGCIGGNKFEKSSSANGQKCVCIWNLKHFDEKQSYWPQMYP